MLSRRHFLSLAAASQLAALFGSRSEAAIDKLDLGPARPFSYDRLKAMARELAAKPYAPPPRPNPDIVSKIDYDAHGKLRYRPDVALWKDGPSTYPITFQHVGMFFPKTVRMHVVEGREAREVIYHPEYFAVGPEHVASQLPARPSAFAGFWVMESRNGPDWRQREPWATFLGASYFRGVGELGQVGLSARGIALTPAGPGPEEFPDFTAFWFEPAKGADEPLTVYALLDSPSICGAYRFLLRRTKGVVMDIDTTLHLRADVDRLGVAPLTSMFWYSETTSSQMIDWRPEVHDSDGLAIWNGAGERIWRPLNNPGGARVSAFLDNSPRGFGLMQRDREFGHYLDGVRYHLRPSAWVEPVGEWGPGAVHLVEIPTDDEIHDNIVAYWCPQEPAKAGRTLSFAYRLHWLADEPYPTPLARVMATRLGRGGQPGLPRPQGVRKFMVEFKGPPLEKLPFGVKPEPVLWASRGRFGDYVFTEAVPNDVPGHWRTQFDLIVEGSEPVDMRCYLRLGETTLSETWLYQYLPAGR